jgi:hypothetical protein
MLYPASRVLTYIVPVFVVVGGDRWPSTAIRGPLGGRIASIIRLVPGISAITLLAFALHG